MPDSPTGTPAGLSEDVEDLKAQVRALTNQVNKLTQPPAADHTDQAEDQDRTNEETEEGAEGWQFPPFILLLDHAEYGAELRALVEFVEGVLVPGYLDEASADARWCHQWTQHPVAIARLHALWLAWQELTDPDTCGYAGPSTWHRDHYDPCMRELRASTGPFQGCTKGEHQIAHRMPSLVPSAWRHAGSC
ncbi:DUF4913 domain-containing protein [Streptomyces sp. ZAF1911]|uniref:DUF4913 domain-containing protein n=1 Tax=Streptomyces sp. ZAF1911 TaxID=2944129 RepID=UPI00237A29E7|nr:DUF4913 domain-containing protein [Streptomyces sp. ZAF1911]MDD9383174.1 DUF4913 domain-containing protein [Streptomyces sp. ZAF1911]